MRISMRSAAGLAAATLAALTLGTGSANATTASTNWNLPGGDVFQVNAWHCGTYVNACSWTTSTKLLGSSPYNASWIRNKASLEAHGISASLTISSSPSAGISWTSKSLGSVTWTNTNNWEADFSGLMTPGWTTVYVSTQSCGSAKVNSSISVSEKCVYAGAA
ncbi:hypothetical protein [Streptacidiphilus rugosus]|uniref:hypothetical protein n=1 Tax=Streptacidiphilus rugosus TaxID=405783 RepID=UPI000565CE7C|nr:hypothetical protein [Streptacidiphilus rugosus]